MTDDNPRGAMFRVLVPDRHARVTNAELFFDLVFVFAVTQLSHTLLHHFTPLGAVQVTLLFLAVWWVWVYTTWVTNWLDPDRTPVRILLFLLMLGGLVLSTTIPTGLRGARPVVCRRLCRDADRPHRVLAAGDAEAAHAGASQCAPHPDLALRFRGVLDFGRLRRRRDAALSLDRGARNRIRLAPRCGSGRRASAFPRWRRGRSKAATWPNAAPASSSSRSARPSSSTARHLPN